MSLIHPEPGLNRSFLRNLLNSNFDAKTRPILARVSILLTAYGFWILIFRLIAMTFVIYFLTRTSGKQVLFEEVNETFAAHELSIIGFGAAAFVLILKGFAPLWRESSFQIVSWPDIRQNFMPGFLQGMLLAAALVTAFLLAGTFRFVGFFVQIEDTPLALFGIFVRSASLVAFVFCEEVLFRRYSLASLLRQKGDGLKTIFWKVGVLSVAYCVIKLIQFDLGWMHLITLLLLSLALSVRQLNGEPPSRGAGFWCGILICFQPLFSLPVFGSDFSGVFLVKYQEYTTPLRLFSGGAGGPLAGFAFQFLLLIETVRGLKTYLKTDFKADMTAETSQTTALDKKLPSPR
jgi:hypothetical protein